MKLSAYIVDTETVASNKAKIIKSNITQEEFDNLAQEQGYTKRVPDTTLVGYYYVNDQHNALKSHASCRKEGEDVNLC